MFAGGLIDHLWAALCAIRASCVIHPGEPRWRVMLASPHRTYHPQAPYGDPWHTADPQEQSLPDSRGRGDRRALRRSLRRDGGDVSKGTDCNHGRCNRPVSPARDPRSHKRSGARARERPARARRIAECNSMSQPGMTGSVDERIIVETNTEGRFPSRTSG